MHNPALAALGLDWRYLACDVHPDRLREAIAGDLREIAVHRFAGRHGKSRLFAARQGPFGGRHFGFLTQHLPHL